MITGFLKAQVDRVWDAFWSGGISNHVTVIEHLASQQTYAYWPVQLRVLFTFIHFYIHLGNRFHGDMRLTREWSCRFIP